VVAGSIGPDSQFRGGVAPASTPWKPVIAYSSSKPVSVVLWPSQREKSNLLSAEEAQRLADDFQVLKRFVFEFSMDSKNTAELW